MIAAACLLACVLGIAVPASAAPSAPMFAAESFDAAYAAAMPAYYAALLASARGDRDATLRNLLVFDSRWTAVAHADGAPPWATGDEGRKVLADVASRVTRARARATNRDVGQAHGELEAVRGLLRDARARHHLSTFDDAVTDYHEALERLLGRVAQHHEFTLTPADFRQIGTEQEHAAKAWTDATALAGTRGAWWQELNGRHSRLLGELKRAADSADGPGLEKAAEALKAAYFDLIGALSKPSR